MAVNHRKTVYLLTIIGVSFLALAWISLGNTNYSISSILSTEVKPKFLIWNPDKYSAADLLGKLKKELDWTENEHPEAIIPTENPQSVVNKDCPRYIMQDIQPGPGLGHVTGQYTTTLKLAVWYNLTIVHSPISNPDYSAAPSKGVHGEYDDLDSFLGMGLGEIQKKDFDFKSVKIVNLDKFAMAPSSTNEGENFKGFTETIVKQHGQSCNVLFKQAQFFQYDYSGMTRWIQVRKWMKNRQMRPMKTDYDRNYINIALHVRTGDIEPHRGTPEEFFYNLVYDYLIPILGDLPYRIYIYSEGLDPKRFPNLAKLPNMIERTDKTMDAYQTYHHLIESDILVMSRSGFSQFAAIFSHRPLVFSPPSRESFPLRFPPIGSIAATLKGQVESQDVMRIHRFRERWIRTRQIKEQIQYLEQEYF